jgi:hypothetical protein
MVSSSRKFKTLIMGANVAPPINVTASRSVLNENQNTIQSLPGSIAGVQFQLAQVSGTKQDSIVKYDSTDD